jgi:hypothetical protein
VDVEWRNKIFCTVCCDFVFETSGMGTFIKGSDSFKLESIKARDFSEGHKKNIMKQKAGSESPKGTPQAEKSLIIMNNSVITKFIYLFRTAHFITKYDKPYSESKICYNK